MSVTNQTGIQIPGAGADDQYLPQYNTLLQNDEGIVNPAAILTKKVMERGGAEKLLATANQINATLDPASNAREMGIKPLPEGTGGIASLPPTTISKSKNQQPTSPTTGGSDPLNTTSGWFMDHRSKIKKAYGIGG